MGRGGGGGARGQGGGGGGDDGNLRRMLLAILAPGGGGGGGGGGGAGQRRGGGGGSGGGGPGGGGNRGGARPTGPQGNGGDRPNRFGGNGGRGGGGIGDTVARVGVRSPDWDCRACGCVDNFGRRSTCRECGAPRGGQAQPPRGGNAQPRQAAAAGAPARAGARGSGSTARDQRVTGPQRERHALGRPPISAQGLPPTGLRPQAAPSVRTGGLAEAAAARPAAVGADGRRPLLAWAGVAARPPQPTAPTPTQPGAPGGTQRGTPPCQGAPAAGPRRPAGGPIVDAEGFTLVQRQGGGSAAAPAATEVLDERDGGASSADATMEAAEDGGREAARTDHRDPTGAGDTDESDAAPPSADELKAAWQQEQGLLDLLVQRGYSAEHPVRVAAQHQADEAHRMWMGATPGVAITQRLLWADKALQRVKKGQARLEQELDDLDRAYEHDRYQLCQRLHEQRARVKFRETKLAELSREAAGAFGTGGDDDGEGGDVIRGAVEAIEEQLAPAMRAAHDLAPEGSPLRAKLEEAMGTIAAVHGMATHASRARWADVYDMSREDESDPWWEDDGDDDGWSQHRGWWPNSRRHYTWGDERHHDQWGSQPWQGGPSGSEEEDAPAMDTGDVQVPTWMRAEGSDGTQWGLRSWKRGRREAEDAAGLQGRLAGGGAASEAARDHERTALFQARVQDAQAQQRQQQQHDHPQLAQAGAAAPAPPTPRAEDHAALEERRRAIWDQAQNDGVAVAAETLAGMDRATLEEWAAAHLL